MRTSGLGLIDMHEYYLKNDNKNLTDNERREENKRLAYNSHLEAADYEKLLTELLADAIAVGAMTLPSNYDAKEFLFTMAPGGNYPHQKIAEVRLMRNGRTQFSKHFSHFHYNVSMDRTMSSESIITSLRRTAESITNLLAMLEKHTRTTH